ncbi:hypothetical protein FRC12_017461 [Ceratobasidium sp. 428]|nr:hypothetical protein FRC12_017461 [Ceratobasidium sp. 428]
MVSLFPSLQHFEGPSFLCIAIVKSSLAPQLESLKILDLSSPSSLARDNKPSVNAICDLAASAESLPTLSSLQFFVDPGTRTSRVIHELTRAAPELRELAINEATLQQLKIPESLHAPKMRKLTISAGIITPTRLRVLLEACPLLEEIRDTYQPRLTRIWRVSRRADGSAELKVSPECQV